ncbi:hypothetical protein AB833_16975 [Chromatiales bacterium (ex Bugula neritina AB1)]|nr:hypothetical protein AB833_16975 [Chromatiales bacterium (ex Bugula neritina AB1)]
MKLAGTTGTLALAAGICLSLSACSTSAKVGSETTAAHVTGSPEATPTAAELEAIAEKSRLLDSRAEELDKRAADLDKRESILAEQEVEQNNEASNQNKDATGNNYGAGDLLPPDAKPGQCFTRLWVPPSYETVSERILIEDEGIRIEVIPAKYTKLTKRILVKEASEKLVTVPATFKTVTERVLVKAATRKLVQVPAVYETVTERVIDKPAHTTWKKGTGPIQRIDETTGEIMCLVHAPATYKSIRKKVLKTPPSTREVEIPAVYSTVRKRVIATPATTRKVKIPAEYKTVIVTEEASPPRERKITIPAKYATVTKRRLVRDGMMDWREILCETNMTRDRISRIQSALKATGHNPGAIDGVIGTETITAINSFQRARGLPVDRYLNIATVRALGVSPN